MTKDKIGGDQALTLIPLAGGSGERLPKALSVLREYGAQA